MNTWKPGPPDPAISMVWEVQFPAGMQAVGLAEAPPAIATRVAPGVWEITLDPGGRNETVPITNNDPKWTNLEVRPCIKEES